MVRQKQIGSDWSAKQKQTAIAIRVGLIHLGPTRKKFAHRGLVRPVRIIYAGCNDWPTPSRP